MTLAQRKEKAAGFSLIELLIVVAIILLIAGIAIPNLLKSRRAANESSAAATLRAISKAASGYRLAWNNGYPPDLAAMAPPTSGTPSCDAGAELDPALACANEPCERNGYQFAYAGGGDQRPPAAGCSEGGYNGYSVQARPRAYRISGVKSYYMDATGLIRQTSEDRPATASDDPI